MSWKYSQSSGQLIGPDGTSAGFGFAGHGIAGANQVSLQYQHMIGPLPQGDYTMSAWFDKKDPMGLCVIKLDPATQEQMHGRADFYIHGSRNLLTGGLNAFLDSSDGCICIGDCTLRRAIWSSVDHSLVVMG